MYMNQFDKYTRNEYDIFFLYYLPYVSKYFQLIPWIYTSYFFNDDFQVHSSPRAIPILNSY